MYGNPDVMAMVARARQAELLKEAERDRVAKSVGRETANSYRNRRLSLRPQEILGLLVTRLTGGLSGGAKARPQALTREPAV